MRKHFSILIPALALALGLALAAPRTAAALEASPGSPAFATPGLHSAPRVAGGKDGGFAILWLRESGSLAVRVFSPSGAPLGAERTLFQQRHSGGGTFRRAWGWDVAALPGGGFVAVWNEVTTTGNTSYSVLRLQVLDAAGVPAGTPRDLQDAFLFSPFSAAVDAAGILTLIEEAGASTEALRYTLEGVPAGPAVALAGGPTPGLIEDAEALPDGGFAVIHNPLQDGLPLTLRRLRPDGTPTGAEVAVQVDRPVFSTGNRVAAGPAGHIVVAWRESVSPRPRILARVFGPDGQPAGPETVVAVSPMDLEEGDESFALISLTVRSDGAFLIQWHQSPGLHLIAGAFTAGGRRTGADVSLAGPSPEIHADAAALPGDGWISTWTAFMDLSAPAGPWFSFLTNPCNGTAPGLCLNGGRFRAEVDWHVPATGARGAGQPIPLTGDTGAFWFFQPGNYELTVKVLDGRGTNGHFWVFYGSLTDVEFDLTVTDTLTGEVRTYHNPAGTMASRGDTTAF